MHFEAVLLPDTFRNADDKDMKIIILPLVLYLCNPWFINSRKKYKLKAIDKC